jgi:hypothetical protein
VNSTKKQALASSKLCRKTWQADTESESVGGGLVAVIAVAQTCCVKEDMVLKPAAVTAVTGVDGGSGVDGAAETLPPACF